MCVTIYICDNSKIVDSKNLITIILRPRIDMAGRVLNERKTGII